MRFKTEFKKKLRKDLGARLCHLRESLELSRNKMAGLLNVTRSAFQRNEEGRWFPEYTTSLKLSEVFNVSMDWILANKGPMYHI